MVLASDKRASPTFRIEALFPRSQCQARFLDSRERGPCHTAEKRGRPPIGTCRGCGIGFWLSGWNSSLSDHGWADLRKLIHESPCAELCSRISNAACESHHARRDVSTIGNLGRSATRRSNHIMCLNSNSLDVLMAGRKLLKRRASNLLAKWRRYRPW